MRYTMPEMNATGTSRIVPFQRRTDADANANQMHRKTMDALCSSICNDAGHGAVSVQRARAFGCRQAAVCYIQAEGVCVPWDAPGALVESVRPCSPCT